MKIKPFLFFIFFVFLLTSGFGCKFTSKKVLQRMQPIKLSYWRVYDGPDAFQEIIAAYSVIHPYVTIEYRKLRFEEYEQELLNAYAEDRAPDIISIHNTWVKKYQSKINPMPETVELVYPVTTGSIKKETIPELKTVKCLTVKELKDNFVDTVYNDVVFKVTDEKTKQTTEKIFGLPLSLDALAMYYNRDLLDNAGIAKPPQYWNGEFQQDVRKLTKQDLNGQIIQAGVGMGGSTNIERYSDILSVLMMQNGAMMMDGYSVTFNLVPPVYQNQNYNPGLEALIFYTDFSNPIKEVYSWNKNLDNSLDMFVQGRLAMMFGYAYHLPIIRGKAEKLNFGIAKLPQIEGSTKQMNFANYWVEAVTSKSKHPSEAWDFVQFAAKEENVKSYLKKSQKPTALRNLVKEQIEDQDIGVFADEVLTAKSWYKGMEPQVAEQIMGEMIDSTASGTQAMEQVINMGAKKVQQTINK